MLVYLCGLKRNLPCKALVMYLRERWRSETARDNYLFDCLWLLATDNRARKLPRYSEYSEGRHTARETDGMSGRDIMEYLLEKMNG